MNSCSYRRRRLPIRALAAIAIVGLPVLAHRQDTTTPEPRPEAVTATQRKARPTIRVVVLGTFHMGAEPGPFNPTITDLQSKRRQKELDALVARLAAFRPTKVALEALPKSSLSADYSRYLAGKLRPAKDERHQVGFRLARRLGLETVQCIDHDLTIDVAEILKKAHQHGLGVKVAKTVAAYRKATAQWNSEFMRDHSMLEIYRSFNSPKTDAANHDVFASLVSMGTKSNPFGAVALARWHERNIRIAANVIHGAKRGDRILVLIGANHRKLLIRALRGAPGVEVKDARELLGG